MCGELCKVSQVVAPWMTGGLEQRRRWSLKDSTAGIKQSLLASSSFTIVYVHQRRDKLQTMVLLGLLGVRKARIRADGRNCPCRLQSRHVLFDLRRLCLAHVGLNPNGCLNLNLNLDGTSFLLGMVLGFLAIRIQIKRGKGKELLRHKFSATYGRCAECVWPGGWL